MCLLNFISFCELLQLNIYSFVLKTWETKNSTLELESSERPSAEQ